MPLSLPLSPSLSPCHHLHHPRRESKCRRTTLYPLVRCGPSSPTLTKPSIAESTTWILGKRGPSGFSAYSTAEEVTEGINGTGLTAIVTGPTSGHGAQTARTLALRGVHVVMAVRNRTKGENGKEAILKEFPNAKVDVMELDLSSMASVRKFASEFNSSGLPLNILVNNAGIMGVPFMISEENIEMHFATNYIGILLLLMNPVFSIS